MNFLSSAVAFKKRAALGLALSLVATAFAFTAGSVAPASAAPAAANTPVPFLTLPFQANSNMDILSGWYYNGGGTNMGIDFVSGSYNSSRSWGSFPVIAAADGLACANCTSRQGNAVWISHKVNGVTYYTYYGHLSSIAGDIPVGSQSRTVAVKRGQFLGMSGDTGARGVTHLHFALMNASSRALDPYSIVSTRGAYPAPNQQAPGVGWFK